MKLLDTKSTLYLPAGIAPARRIACRRSSDHGNGEFRMKQTPQVGSASGRMSMKSSGGNVRMGKTEKPNSYGIFLFGWESLDHTCEKTHKP